MSYYGNKDYYYSPANKKKHGFNKFDEYNRKHGQHRDDFKTDDLKNLRKKDDADFNNALQQDIKASQKAVALNGGDVSAPLTVGPFNFGVVIHVVVASAALNMATNNANNAEQENALKVGTEEYGV